MPEKRLYRSRENRMIAGVAGGLAEYFEVDPTLVRLIVLIFVIAANGFGLLLYILAWIIIPENPNQAPTEDSVNNVTDQTEAKAEPKTKSGPVHHKVELHTDTHEDSSNRPANSDGRVFGIVLLLLGLFFFANYFMPMGSLLPFWPVILIVVGLWLAFSSMQRKG